MMDYFEGVNPPPWKCTEENQEKTDKWIEEQLKIKKQEDVND